MSEVRRVRARCFLAVWVLLLSGATAAADSIQITSGSLIATENSALGHGHSVTLAGDGFTFEGVTGFGIWAPEQCQFDHCVAGATVDLNARWLGFDLPGNATLNGRTFTNVGSAAADSSMLAEWTGTLEIPVGFTGGLLTAPFQFTGLFTTLEPSGEFQDVGLFGAGTARVTFAPHAAFPGAFNIERLSFDFEAAAAPVPEPASMLLLGTGLAGLAAMRRRCVNKN